MLTAVDLREGSAEATIILKHVTDDLEPRPVFLQPTAAATSGASAIVSTPVFIEPRAEATSGASLTLSAPLVQVAGTAVYPTEGASQVTISPRQGSAVPEVDIRLTKNMWDMTTTGFGIAAGAAIAQRPGAIIGGFGMYGLGYLRWRYVQRKRDSS